MNCEIKVVTFVLIGVTGAEIALGHEWVPHTHLEQARYRPTFDAPHVVYSSASERDGGIQYSSSLAAVALWQKRSVNDQVGPTAIQHTSRTSSASMSGSGFGGSCGDRPSS